jgi:hypothetical protein
MIDKNKKRCAKCGKRIKKGGTAYWLKAELISAFDGYIYSDEKINLDDLIDRAALELEGQSPEEIEEQVYKKFEYLICAGCRDELDKLLGVEEMQ